MPRDSTSSFSWNSSPKAINPKTKKISIVLYWRWGKWGRSNRTRRKRKNRVWIDYQLNASNLLWHITRNYFVAYHESFSYAQTRVSDPTDLGIGSTHKLLSAELATHLGCLIRTDCSNQKKNLTDCEHFVLNASGETLLSCGMCPSFFVFFFFPSIQQFD